MIAKRAQSAIARNEIPVSTTARPAARTGNGLAWCMMIGGILFMPFTSGLSFGATLIGGFMLRSSDPSAPDESINDMALVAEQATTGSGGCWGCVFSWATIITVAIGFTILAALVAAAGGQP